MIAMGTETGTVEFYDADRGYGFCRIDGRAGPSAFLHVSNVRDQNDVGVSSVPVVLGLIWLTDYLRDAGASDLGPCAPSRGGRAH